MSSTHNNEGEKVMKGCILTNVMLTVVKLLAGIFGNSKAMVADALHSASDIVADTVVLIGLKIANKPIDDNHHYGHGKAEPIAAAFVGISLMFAATMIVKGIIESIIENTFVTPNFLALGAALLSIVVKEILFRIAYKTGKKIKSEAMVADAWHQRSDALSSVGSFLGILGSMIGGWLNIPILGYLDPIAGAVVACLIYKVAFDIIKNAMTGLMDTSPESEKVDEIKEIATNVDGVVSCSIIKARYVGPHLYVDIYINVYSKITVEEGHDIAAEVKKRLIESIHDVSEVLVHVDPVNEKGFKLVKGV